MQSLTTTEPLAMIDRIVVLMLGLAVTLGAAASDADDVSGSRTLRIAGNVDISQAVQGPLVVIGGNVAVSAPVTGKVKLVGGKVTIASGAVMSSDVSVAGGDVKVDGAIGGTLRAAGGHVWINGPVAGGASIAAGKLDLGPDARIQGTLKFRGEELRRDPAAQVVGGIEQDFTSSHWHERTPMERFAHGWFWTAGLMVLAALIAAALPGPSNRLASELREHPGVTMLLGLVALTTIPVAAVLFMITIIGIPIGVIAILLYVVLLLTGYVWLAVVAGGMLLDRVKPEVAALAGWRAGMAVLAMLVIALLVRVPYVGGLAHLVALVLGVGMIAAAVFRQRTSPDAAHA
jgi:cytoskeletal protein CcmA (bactofilin family)